MRVLASNISREPKTPVRTEVSKSCANPSIPQGERMGFESEFRKQLLHLTRANNFSK
jgi:hypothetical protein